MAPRRRFDHSIARARYLNGESGPKFAAALGVSYGAVWCVVRDIRAEDRASVPPPGGARRLDREAIVAAHDAGVAVKDIAARHAADRATISAIVKAFGRVRHPARRGFDWAEAARMRAAGVRQVDVARHFGVDPAGVYRAMRKLAADRSEA